jgi:hypothetical protein
MAVGIVGVAGGLVVAAPWLVLNHAVPARFSLIYALPIVFCVRMLWPGNRYLRTSTSIDINRSPTDVSAFLADARNAVTWQGPQLRSMSILSGEPGAAGAIYRALVVFENGRVFQGDTKLDEYRPGQMLRWLDLDTGGPATSIETTTLQQQGSSTHLISRCRANMNGGKRSSGPGRIPWGQTSERCVSGWSRWAMYFSPS